MLYQGVKGVTDLMVRPGIINLDFADVRSVMNEMGKAMMGTGESSGEDRAVQAAEKAIANPLLDEISLKGAKGVLINITAGPDLTLFELDEAANRIRAEVDPDANIMVGSTLDPEMAGRDAGLGRRHRHRRGRASRTRCRCRAAPPSRSRPRRRGRAPAAAAPGAAGAAEPGPSRPARPSFADHRRREVEREELFAEPEAAPVPQPAACSARRPSAQPKLEGEGDAPARRAVARRAAAAAGGGAERAQGPADGPPDRARSRASPSGTAGSPSTA